MDSKPYALDFWVGQEVGVLIPALCKDCISATIRGVESGGVWIECPQLNVSFCCGRTVPEEWEDAAKVIAFFPYSQIVFIATLDRKAMSGPAKVISFNIAKSGAPANCNPREGGDDNPNQPIEDRHSAGFGSQPAS
jgi:hypothetical protein